MAPRYSLAFGLAFVCFFQMGHTRALDSPGEEPTCMSRFDYDFKMLKTMVDISKETEELRETVAAVSARVDQLTGQTPVGQKPVCCPEGAFKREKSCYIFSEVAATWAAAMGSCIKDFGGHLAVITDEEENNYIKELAGRERPQDRLWIGGTDAFKENEWRWITTMEISSASTFTDWQSGQPDNQAGTEHCMELHPTFGFRWNDDKCYNLHKYICEIAVE